MPQTTLKRYFALLEATFLVERLPPWSGNLGKRLVKTPKLHLHDTGLATALLGIGEARLAGDDPLRGPLLESFVVAEIRKQLGWSKTRPRLFHFRTQVGHEVDVVLEDPRGRCVGVEVKAGSIDAADFKGLRTLADALGPRFLRGVILHPGRSAVPFSRNLHALPLQVLWRTEARA